MSQTLKQQIAADSSAVFLNTNELADDVVHYPAGDLTSPVTVQAVVDRDLEDTGGAGSGEGLQYDNAGGSKLRRKSDSAKACYRLSSG